MKGCVARNGNCYVKGRPAVLNKCTKCRFHPAPQIERRAQGLGGSGGGSTPVAAPHGRCAPRPRCASGACRGAAGREKVVKTRRPQPTANAQRRGGSARVRCSVPHGRGRPAATGAEFTGSRGQHNILSRGCAHLGRRAAELKRDFKPLGAHCFRAGRAWPAATQPQMLVLLRLGYRRGCLRTHRVSHMSPPCDASVPALGARARPWREA
jgi:hypothetical protein